VVHWSLELRCLIKNTALLSGIFGSAAGRV